MYWQNLFQFLVFKASYGREWNFIKVYIVLVFVLQYFILFYLISCLKTPRTHALAQNTFKHKTHT